MNGVKCIQGAVKYIHKGFGRHVVCCKLKKIYFFDLVY